MSTSLSICLTLAYSDAAPPPLHSFPTRRSSDLASHNQPAGHVLGLGAGGERGEGDLGDLGIGDPLPGLAIEHRSEEHTSELQSRGHLVCRLLLEKTKKQANILLWRPPDKTIDLF